MLLYIWFLLTIPTDRIVCTLWISQPPTAEALIQACGTNAINAYRLDVLYADQVVCTQPGSSLLWVQEQCHLSGPLSEYKIVVIEPNYQELIDCSVTTPTNAQPSDEEIKRQCPDVKQYVLKFAGTRQPDPPAAGICLPPDVAQPATIATSENYHLLAGKLIWWDYAHAACDGLSGVDPSTFAATACGLDGARVKMLEWQNGMDMEILAAADRWHVPAALIKQIIATETQYWPWTGTNDEHGLIQITDDGAEIVLHQYQPGYDRLKPSQRREARWLWLRSLDCDVCSPVQAYDHAKAMMPEYAKALAAYYCTYGDWSSAMRAWNIKHQLIANS